MATSSKAMKSIRAGSSRAGNSSSGDNSISSRRGKGVEVYTPTHPSNE